MEYLMSFIDNTEHNEYYEIVEKIYPNVSYLKDSNYVMYMEKPIPSPIKCVFYDSATNEFVKIYSGNVRYVDSYTPIGVEIIPPYHDIYGNGKGGVISLKYMDNNNPTIGTLSTDVKMCWGPNVDEPNLFNGSRVVVLTSDGSLSVQNFGYLIKNGSYNYGSGHIPNPYNEDKSRNPQYYSRKETGNNALSDFKGKQNTQYLVNTRGVKDYSTWKPSSTAIKDYPAASVCNMYSTIGTYQGDWYLPSAGELGYLMVFWDEVQRCFDVIRQYYGEESAVNPLNGDGLWTSTENQAKNARYVETNNGLGYSDKTTNYRIRAFIQI